MKNIIIFTFVLIALSACSKTNAENIRYFSHYRVNGFMNEIEPNKLSSYISYYKVFYKNGRYWQAINYHKEGGYSGKYEFDKQGRVITRVSKTDKGFVTCKSEYGEKSKVVECFDEFNRWSSKQEYITKGKKTSRVNIFDENGIIKEYFLSEKNKLKRYTPDGDFLDEREIPERID